MIDHYRIRDIFNKRHQQKKPVDWKMILTLLIIMALFVLTSPQGV